MRQSLNAMGIAVLFMLFMPVRIFALPQEDFSTNQENPLREYTKENPLVFEDALDLWPYAFRNDNGEEMGYNLDLVRAIMEKLNIPYVIRLKDRSQVLNDLKDGKADLSLGMDAHFHNPYAKFGKVLVHLFTHSVVWPKKEKQTIFKLSDLGHETVIVHKGSYSHHLMESNGWHYNAIPHTDMKHAIIELSESEEGQILWNTASLKSLLHMYHIDNLNIAPVEMTDGEYRFMSNDKWLLNKIDSVYNEIDSRNELSSLQNKWFYPETQNTNIPSWIWNILNISIILSVLLIFFAVWAIYRERRAIEEGKKRTRRLALIMHTSGLSIWLFDIKARKFTWLDHDGVASQRYPISAMANRVGEENMRRIAECLDRLESEEVETLQLEVVTFAESNPAGGDRIYVINLSVLRREHGKPSIIIAVCSDIYEERKRQQEALERLSRYRSVFDTALVDMVYHDKDGYIADMNERAQKTFRMSLQEVVKNKISMQQIMNIKDFDYNSFDYFYSTLFVKPDGTGCTAKAENAMFYELQLVPIHDEQGALQCAYGTGRDVTEAVLTYRSLQKSVAEVKQATQKVTDYAQNINYVMGVGGVRMAFYSPSTHTLTIFKGLEVIQHTLTQSRCMTLAHETSKKTAMRALNSMDELTKNSITADIMTTLRVKGKNLFLQFRFVPTFDAEGNVNGYFGMCRDLSEIKATEVLLQKETVRAQEVEDLKNSFLRNMSYEIRTPLNAVVGFSDLFELDHTPEDELIFIEEIKNNSAHLLDLINDILFLSRLDAHMIEINKQPTDFSLSFANHCEAAWADYQKEGVKYIVENRYDQLVVDIDDTNIGRVIEQIVRNAVQHTDQGMVSARYDYINGKLFITIEDTGKGMSEELLSQIYERFTSGNHKGTGLGLPICKELTEQMGGTIEINSTEGKGTVVWIVIPATASAINRKNDY